MYIRQQNKIVSIFICLVIITFGLGLIFEYNTEFSTVKGAVLTVNDDGGAMYTSIQAAINNAGPGDIIEVWEGTYNENLVINKKVEIIGNDKLNTIINAGGSTHAVSVTSDWVNISGVMVTNGGVNGILLDTVSNCTIYDTYCKNIGTGVRLFYSDNNIINNNTFDSNSNGIWSYSSSNNKLTNNTCILNGKGIYLTSSFNSKIINNTCLNNTDGIRLEGSDDNILNENNCSMNYGSAILLSSSDFCTIKNNYLLNNVNGIHLSSSEGAYVNTNTMISCGVSLQGNILQNWNRHSIDLTNTANNKPVYYLKNQTGGVVPAGAGQVILANCSYVIVQNQQLDHVSWSIIIGFSDNNTVNSNSCNFSNTVGIKLADSSWNQVINNYCSNGSGYGMVLEESSNNTIQNNSCDSNGIDGIRSYTSFDCLIDNNCFNSNQQNGMYLKTLSRNIISNNTCNLNNKTGIWLNTAPDNLVKYNIINSNGICGILATDSPGIIIQYTTCNYNTDYGIRFSSSLDNFVRSCNISSNNIGVRFSGYSNATINYSTISNNYQEGINNTHPSILVNAINNSWGDPSGPYHPTKNPEGEGDNVTDQVLFIPWLPALPPVIETDDITIIIEDELYKNTYSAYEPNKDPITWKYSSNASWLYYFPGNHTLFGLPTNTEVGLYWICINVSDDQNGYDEHNFTLNVINKKPTITTADITSITEDSYYYNDYASDDDDQGMITWNLNTNATWLTLDSQTGVLNGTPSNDDVGLCRVNVSVNDGNGGIGFSNFTINVENQNDIPIITTNDIITINEDEYYQVIYNAIEIDIGDVLLWTYYSDAVWLNWGQENHTLYGTPRNEDVGEYWVSINISDGNGGYDEHSFILTVINVNDNPEITTENVTVAIANKDYNVDYKAIDVDSPLSQFIWSLASNATWLDLDSSTGVLSGTPSNIDVGWYNVNISVDDGDGGHDWQDFILIVEKENDQPEITTIDQVSISAGKSYNVIYDAIDDRTPLESLLWSYDSNASWLGFSKLTRVLSGNPTLSDVGWYWVNITVNDGEGGFDSHNFTLTVWATANEPPDILTEDDVNAVVDELYSVDYEAEDDHTPIDKLEWSLETNTSDWLDIDPETGVLSGTPELKDVGSYWVKVSVNDGEDGWDFTNFTLYVTTEPITDFKPELSNSTMTPTSGNTDTEFTFSVDYSHPDGDPPDSIQVVIDGKTYGMTATNGHFEYKTKLSEGNHTYYFTTKLGDFKVDTGTFNTGYIAKAEEQPDDGDGEDDEDNTMLYALIGIIVIIIVVLILLFMFLKKKKEKEELPVKEAQPPPTDEIPPEVPPEQPPTPEVPPEQPPVPEVSQEQVPVTETPPQEQPQVPEVTPEQPPTPEVTPQVPQPQVEPAPTELEPMPQVEEQPKPQVEVQEPQGQAPMPKIKTDLKSDE